MKKTIITAIPMRGDIQQTEYQNFGNSQSFSQKTAFPTVAYIDLSIQKDDVLEVLMLVKTHEYAASSKNIEQFQKEVDELAAKRSLTVTYHEINTVFAESINNHEGLMCEIAQMIEPGSHIIADITYGPKELPIVLFAALSFAEKFLDATIEKILYGYGCFDDRHNFINAKLCEMNQLYSLHSLVSAMNCNSADDAKSILKAFVRR